MPQTLSIVSAPGSYSISSGFVCSCCRCFTPRVSPTIDQLPTLRATSKKSTSSYYQMLKEAHRPRVLVQIMFWYPKSYLGEKIVAVKRSRMTADNDRRHRSGISTALNRPHPLLCLPHDTLAPAFACQGSRLSTAE